MNRRLETRTYQSVADLRGWWAGHLSSGAGDSHFYNYLTISAGARTDDEREGQIDGRIRPGRAIEIADTSAKCVMMEEGATVGLRFGLDGDFCGVDVELIERASNAHNVVEAIRSHLAIIGNPVSDDQAWKHWRKIAEG